MFHAIIISLHALHNMHIIILMFHVACMLDLGHFPCMGHARGHAPYHYVKALTNLLYYIWFKHCINNPLLELQLSLWDLIWYMHVTFISHDRHVCTMHVDITITCMSPQHSCYMHVPYNCNMHVA